jgi:hypothetical protein
MKPPVEIAPEGPLASKVGLRRPAQYGGDVSSQVANARQGRDERLRATQG